MLAVSLLLRRILEDGLVAALRAVREFSLWRFLRRAFRAFGLLLGLQLLPQQLLKLTLPGGRQWEARAMMAGVQILAVQILHSLHVLMCELHANSFAADTL